MIWLFLISVFAAWVVLFPAFLRYRATTFVLAATDAASGGRYAEAKRLVELAINHDQRLRRVEAVHLFYADIQRDLHEEILTSAARLRSALEQRETNIAERLWHAPVFRQAMLWLFVLVMMLKACTAITP